MRSLVLQAVQRSPHFSEILFLKGMGDGMMGRVTGMEMLARVVPLACLMLL